MSDHPLTCQSCSQQCPDGESDDASCPDCGGMLLRRPYCRDDGCTDASHGHPRVDRTRLGDPTGGNLPGGARRMTRRLAEALDDLVVRGRSRAVRLAFVEMAEDPDTRDAPLYAALAFELVLAELRHRDTLDALDQAARALPDDVVVPPLPTPPVDGDVLVCDWRTGRPVDEPPPDAA